MNANIRRGLVAAGVLVAAAAAHAQSASSGAVDVTQVVSVINSQLQPITLVGGACLGIYVAVKAFGWVRKALR